MRGAQVLVVFLGLLAIAGASFGGYYLYITSPLNVNHGPGTTVREETFEPTVVTETNLKAFLESRPLVQELPSKAVIYLHVGNELHYTIKRESVTDGVPQNPDITLSMPVSYIDDLGTIGLCNTIILANDNGDLSAQVHLSQKALLWKYRSVLEYRECFGL